mgnify:CR=1 FL=1
MTGADAALLAALPHLGLSFGPIWFPLACLAFVRIFFYFAWLSIRRNLTDWLRWSTIIAPNLFLSGLALYAFAIEPFQPGITRLEIATHNPPVQPLHILHLSDLHIERITPREREILFQVAEMQPDLIVLTGDFLSTSNLNDPLSWQETRWFLNHLHAPFGVYAVNGNIDSPLTMRVLFEGLPIRVLDDEVEALQLPDRMLYLIGVSHQGLERDRTALKTLSGNIPPGATRVLLYHTPDLIETAAAEGIHLYLAGHTHGGQIRLPFYGAVLTLSVYGKQYEKGHYTVGATHLYVSRGIGMEGWIAPRVRFLCPPEMVEITLH